MISSFLSPTKQVSFENIRKSIILSFVLAVVVAVALVITIDLFIEKRDNSAMIINLAGRQRTLGQKLAKGIHALPRDASLDEVIKSDVELWDSIHRALRHGNDVLGIPRPQNPEIDSLLKIISPLQENMVRLALREDLGKLEAGEYADLARWEAGFLEGMDQVVDVLQTDTEKGLTSLQYIVAVLIAMFVLFLFGLYKILVKPIIKVVHSLSEEGERQVRQSRSILENTRDLIWSVDTEYRLLTYNRAFSEAMMEETGECPKLGDQILDQRYSFMNVEERKRLYDRVFSGEEFQTESKSQNGDGTPRYHELSFHPIVDTEGKVRGCSVYRRDITGRVQTYQELQQSERYLKEAQEIANLGHWNWDMVKDKITWSDQLYKVFGQDPETFEANYEGLMGIIHPEDREAFNADVENCIKNKVLHDIVHRIVLIDGSIRFVHQKGKAFYNAKGEPYRMAGTTQDVTFIERAKRRIQRQYDELQHFVYVISHNIRSPIATLQGLVALFDLDKGMRERAIADIGTMVETLDTTVRDLNHALTLRDISKETFVPVDLEEIMADVEKLLAGDIAEAGATVERDLSGAPRLYGIKSYFSNILYNLVLNAIKYRSTERRPHVRVVSRSTVEGGFEIRVLDNGLGMDLSKREKKEKIFDMYGRFSRDTEGKGLGLYLVKTQVEAMKGTIDVESEPGLGSVFTITMPPISHPVPS
ncbi:PAS domain-containing protein [Flagellimonas ochracea]|nr:PAS domain-containing protein [Allomuricauda ochracea]